MKVTTELKNLIKRSFEEKRLALKKEYKDMAEVQYQEKIEQIIALPEYQNFLNTQAALKEKISIMFPLEKNIIAGPYCNSFYLNRTYGDLNVDAHKILTNNSHNYLQLNEELGEEHGKKLREIDMAQESLLIKLTYEKDLEKIKEMLNEYGISLV